ncbi:MAG: N-acetylneuraminate synthase family protein [Anaerolineales bacterium]
MARTLTLDSFAISDNSDCYIIAEIGHNHQGDLKKAKELFKAAAECGVNAVKLQKRDNKSMFTKAAYHKPYENENSFGATYGEHREALEFGRAEYVELQQYAKELGVTMFATAFDIPSADFLAELDMLVYKDRAGRSEKYAVAETCGGFGKPMIISTGGSNMEDVQRAHDTVMPLNKQLAITAARTSSYPAEHHDLNLRVIRAFAISVP